MRVKITNATIAQQLQRWAQGQERDRQLIFYANEINEQDVKQRAWDLASMIVNFEPDTVSGFTKILFVEKL
jgi:sulfur transfer protein SufE